MGNKWLSGTKILSVRTSSPTFHNVILTNHLLPKKLSRLVYFNSVCPDDSLQHRWWIDALPTWHTCAKRYLKVVVSLPISSVLGLWCRDPSNTCLILKLPNRGSLCHAHHPCHDDGPQIMACLGVNVYGAHTKLCRLQQDNIEMSLVRFLHATKLHLLSKI